MSRGYAVRMALWAALVVGAAAVAVAWSVREVPRAMEAMRAEAAPGGSSPRPAESGFPALDRYVNRPLDWVGRCWPFLAEVGLLTLCVWGAFGRPLGVFDLIHAETRWVRFVNGVVLGFVTGNALFVAYAVTADGVPWAVGTDPTLLPVVDPPAHPGEAAAVRRSGHFLLVVWLPALAVVYLPRLVWPSGDRFPALGLGLLASVPLAAGLAVGGWAVLADDALSGDWREWFAQTPGAMSGRIRPGEYPMHAIATGFVALPAALILVLGAAALRGRVGSPVWVVCLSLWLLNAGYGFLRFHFDGLQFVILASLAAVVVVANARHPYKLCLPNLEPEYAAARAGRPAPLSVTVSPVGGERVALLSADDVLGPFRERWEREHGRGTKPKLVVACVSGGGIRAAVWTAAVLDGLDRAVGSRFAAHLRLVTGASGGMVAAGLYAGSKVHPVAGPSLAAVLAEDSLWPTWQGLFFSDTPAALLPFYRPWDRAKSLEASWKRNARPVPPGTTSAMAATFAELMAAERDGRAPSLIFSPLLVEDGRRLLVSNLDLADLASEAAPTLGTGSDGRAFADRHRVAQPAVEFFRLFPAAHRRFEVCTAARLSATFPYVSPAVSLPTAPPRRVVDAGFFDNYGVGLAAGWLLRNRDAVRRYCGGVCLLEVRAFELEREKTGFPADWGETRAGAGDFLSTVLAGVSTPAEALGVVRAAGAYYRNDHLIGLLDGEFNGGRAAPFFVRTAIECPGDGSLSWAITARERDRIVRLFEVCDRDPSAGVCGPVGGFAGWFGDGGA